MNKRKANSQSNKEICFSCGKHPVEESYSQCTECLNIADAEKYRLENE